MRFEISEVMRQDRVMELVYGNCESPGDLLGRHFVRNGQVIAAFHPEASSMELIDDTGKVYPMDMVERQPIYAVFLQNRRNFPYRIRMSFPDGNTFVSRDPYAFDGQILPEEAKLFSEGVWKDAAQKLGSHPDTVAGVEGTRFAVWAPNARRVSVVGDFNYWNGMIYPMQRVAGTDFFELFLPDVHPGQLYKYEIKNRQGDIYQKRDPFALMNEMKENGASIILNMELFSWDDRRWTASRTIRGLPARPVSICEIYFPEIMYPEEEVRETVLAMGSTHILLKNRPEGGKALSEELSGILEKEDLQANQKGIFEPAYSMSAPDRLRLFINRCHRNHISVLMEITPDYLEKGASYLREFAGIRANVPEVLENVSGDRAFTYFFDEGKEIYNYILTCLAFWIKAYHVDGFVLDGFRRKILQIRRLAESSGLLPGSEEMDALLEKGYEYVGRLRESIREIDSSVLVAGERITADSLLEGQSGWPGEHFSYPDFDLYWDDEILTGLDRFMRTEPDKQAASVSLLTMPVMRAGRHDKLIRINEEWEGGGFGNGAGRAGMTATSAYAFLMGMPGKKVWSLNSNENSLSRRFAQDLFSLYREMPALHESYEAGGRFEWINAQDGVTGIISFIRTAVHGRDSLLFVCNFGTRDQNGYRVGVPKRGIYQPVLTNSEPEYGGNGSLTYEAVEAESIPQDLRDYSIRISLAAKTVVIYRFD